MVSYRFVPISSQKGVLSLRNPVNNEYIIYIMNLHRYLTMNFYLLMLCDTF